jgi:hypothetical protein
MTIEIIVIAGLIFLAATAVAELFELRNDVLYGSYIEGRRNPLAGFRDELLEIMVPMGLRRGVGRFALKVGTVGFFASAIIG